MILKFLVILNIGIAIGLADTCPEGQYKAAGFIDSCVDCPENPKINCKGEGDDAKSCEDSCVKEDISAPSSGINTGKAVGISLGAASLIIIVVVVLGLYFLRRKNNGNFAVENEMEMAVVANGHAEDNQGDNQAAPSSSGPSPSSAAEYQDYPDPETAFDLDIMKDRSSSALNLAELIV